MAATTEPLNVNLAPNVVGKALYLELRRGDYTNQIIITPEGLTASGKYVPTTTYRRRISALSPRKTWKHVSSVYATERNIDGTLYALDRDHALATVADRLSHTNSLFTQLIAGNWKVYKQPIVVEVTKDDLEDVRMGKTPYKILARITRSRRKLGFAEELFDAASA